MPECIFENFENARMKLQQFQNIFEGDLSQNWPEPNMWLLINHTKPTNKVLKQSIESIQSIELISFNNGQLQISVRAITKTPLTVRC